MIYMLYTHSGTDTREWRRSRVAAEPPVIYLSLSLSLSIYTCIGIYLYMIYTRTVGPRPVSDAATVSPPT